MILDSQLQFSDAQAVTAAAASTNVLDLGVARDIGSGKPLYVCLNVDVALDDAGDDSELAVTLETDDNSDFTSATELMALFTLAANAPAGTKKVAVLPPGLDYERYLRLKYTPADGDLSAGSVTAFLTDSYEVFKAYQDNVTIS